MKKVILKTGEAVVIREAVKADAFKIIQHLKKVGDESVFLSFNGAEFDTSLEEEENIIQKHHDAENKILLVAEWEEEIIGVSNILATHKEKMKHMGELGISVVQAHWNKGLGYQMILYLIDWAKANPIIRKLNLEVQVNNTSAINLYSRLGFEKEGLRSRGTLLDGEFYDLLLMGLIID